MVVGDQHLHAQRLRVRHAGHAGDAVVHGDEQVGAFGFDAVCNGRREAIAVHHAIGHHVVDVLRAQQAQPAQGHGTGGGAVAVVVGHDDHAPVGGNGIGQQHGGLARAAKLVRWQQLGEAIVQVVAAGAARGIQLRQQRVHAGLGQGPNGARRCVTGFKSHGGLQQRARVR